MNHLKQVKNVIVCVCMLSIHAFGVQAEPTQAIPPTQRLPVLLTTVGQTQVIVHDMQPEDRRLVLEIRNPDVTSMPSRSTLHLMFDTRVVEVSKPSSAMPLRLEAAVTDQQISLFLARDPFAFPQPWSHTMTIVFNRMPQAGSVSLGNQPPQNVTYPSLAPSVKTLPGT